MDCRVFAFGSADYEGSVAIRDAVLRKALGLTWEEMAFAGEEASFHLGAFEGERLVGSLILLPLEGATLKMRQVAVAAEEQGRGVGAALVRFAEGYARERGFEVIQAHAREAVLPFYVKLGYEIEGETFLEVGIPHRAIWKRLGK